MRFITVGYTGTHTLDLSLLVNLQPDADFTMINMTQGLHSVALYNPELSFYISGAWIPGIQQLLDPISIEWRHLARLPKLRL